MANPPGVDRTLTTRWENKYLIEAALIPSLRSWIEPFMQPDPYSVARSDLKYPVCSLYLDNLNMDLYMGTVQAQKNRFKLRIRSYADESASPVFCEIKKRVNTAVLKVRGQAVRVDAQKFLEACARDPRSAPSLASPDCAEFAKSVIDMAANPKVRIRYKREAWESRSGDPVRVTFDTKVQAETTFDPNLDFREDEAWLNAFPTEKAVLEVKFTEAYPVWLHSLIETFDLHLQSVPKYILGADKTGLAPPNSVFEGV
ncbi:MAG TPA: hypothetical protein DDW23_06370 [Planctomycetes bacterium]|nr:hypothetical protein [Planctomycetota bacterium]